MRSSPNRGQVRHVCIPIRSKRNRTRRMLHGEIHYARTQRKAYHQVMKIPESTIRPFAPHGIPRLRLGIEGGESVPPEELRKIKQAINDFMKTFGHLDLMSAPGMSLVRAGLRLTVIKNGAHWARCKIRDDLGGDPRAFVEYGKRGGRNQLYSVPIPRPKP